MTTVVNARDAYLQAYTPRVNTVTISDNVVIDSSQITGEGFTVVGRKSVALSSSSQIIKNYTATGDDISSITLTAVPSNLTSPAILDIMSGTVSGTHSFGSGYSVTIPTSNIVSDSVQFRVSITEDSITYYDYITVTRSRESSTTIRTHLTQEYIVIPADDAGNPLSYASATGYFKLWQSTYDISTSFTFTVHTNPDSLGVTINPTTGQYSVTSGMASVSSSTLTLRATDGTNTISRILTIVKVDGSYTGVRSRRSFSIPLNGITSFSDSLATTVASTDGGPMLGDVVTQWDTSGSYTKTKFWSGVSWLELNGYVDGNLLVKGTVVADAIAANAVTATKIAANAVTADKIVAGAVTADKLSVTDLSAVGATIGGAVIDSTGVESDDYSSTAGWRLDNDEGKIYARSIDIRNSDSSRVFDLNATGTSPILKVDGVLSVLANGSMTLDAINVINTVNVADGAITSSAADSNSSAVALRETDPETTVVSVSIGSGGKPVYIQASVYSSLEFVSGGGGGGTFYFRVYKDSTLIKQRAIALDNGESSTPSISWPIVIDSPGTGTYTYSIKCQVVTGGAGESGYLDIDPGECSLFVLAMKK